MPLNIDLQQILLHLFNFVVLFAILYFLLYKPVKDFMDKRTEEYRKTDEETKARLEEAEAEKREYAEKLASVDRELAEKRAQAERSLEAQSAAAKKQAEEEAARLIANARKTMESDRARMLREAQTEITELAVNAAQKIVEGGSTSQAYDSFLSTTERGAGDE